jgi:hypothetical protein
MKHKAKRQAVKRRTPLTFFRWIAVFFNQALECDTPILESLHHTMFLYLDLEVVMNPAKLYDNLTPSPAVAKAKWWATLKRIATPKMEYLFPATSPFVNFDRWFACSCFTYDRRRYGYPLCQSAAWDQSRWEIYCPRCSDPGQEPTNPICWYEEWAASPSPGWLTKLSDRGNREDLRIVSRCLRNPCLLDNAQTEADVNWALVFRNKTDTAALIVRPSITALIYHLPYTTAYRCDFITACIMLNRTTPVPILSKKEASLIQIL